MTCGGRKRPAYVLFDLGGVLLDFRGFQALRELLPGRPSDEELLSRWLRCEAVRAFERGHTTKEEFGPRVVRELGIPLPPGEFLAAMANWLHGFLPGAEQLLAALPGDCHYGCLSNSNSLHEAHLGELLGRHLPARFLSHQLGMVKPDREIFERVAEVLAVTPDELLFVDDAPENVEAARSRGWRAERVLGPGECRSALERALGPLVPSR